VASEVYSRQRSLAVDHTGRPAAYTAQWSTGRGRCTIAQVPSASAVISVNYTVVTFSPGCPQQVVRVQIVEFGE